MSRRFALSTARQNANVRRREEHDATSAAARAYRERGHKLALLAGIPRPPYTRENALIVETVGPSVSISIELISPSAQSSVILTNGLVAAFAN
jgi:hypothetical protein